MASVAGGRVRQFFRNETVKQAVTLLSWMPVGIFFTQNLYSIVTITGPSMQPTFNPNINGGSMLHDLVLIEKWSIKMRQYKRGDVVTLWSPQNPHLLTTKRIIALEGDTVHPLPPSAPNPIRIPEGHCWVEGDSYKQSRDSNAYGPIPLGLINGKVKQILWPSTRYGPVSSTAEKSKGRVIKSSRSMISV